MSVADSTSPAAVNMQKQIRKLVAAGYSEDQIKAEFVESYGEWVLASSPPSGGINTDRVGGARLVRGRLGARARLLDGRCSGAKRKMTFRCPPTPGLAAQGPLRSTRLLAELED